VPLYVRAVLWFVLGTVARGSGSIAKKGDALQLRRKLIVLQPELLAYARSLTLDTSGAEDLAHDAVVRALQFGSAPKQITDLRPWMFRIIKNLFLDEKRKERVQREFSITQNRLSDIEPAQTGDPVEALMVRQAYVKLAPREREILCLVDILGLTYAEAATVIDVPTGTVMSRLSRARRAMIEQMGETNVRPLRKRRG
jgi:RNA polymerase sigma-70 factor (ECF subfamily)